LAILLVEMPIVIPLRGDAECQLQSLLVESAIGIFSRRDYG